MTNVPIDEKLLEEVQKVSGQHTSEAAVTAALEEYVRRRKRSRIVELFGTIDYDPDYDYKKSRDR